MRIRAGCFYTMETFNMYLHKQYRNNTLFKSNFRMKTTIIIIIVHFRSSLKMLNIQT